MKRTLKFLISVKSSQYVYRGYKSKVPRVRFAPSPTGYLHLGGLRTAFYNYIFAKSRNGKFILRIEDTDQTRKVDGSVEALIRDLEWIGLSYDEGPGKSGKYGPYIQSQRLEIYQEQIKKLLDNGSAYHCFCTERRLNILRRDAVRAQQIPKYDNRCRNLNIPEAQTKISAGTPYCVRLKLTSDVQSYEDLVFGGIAYDVSLNEGDPVLLKSDGYPTYHLANVIDDHFMGITHVLRGVEWQISTTKHLLLYRAFGWEPPEFGHLPLVVNADGTKLSKRQSDVHIDDYRCKGIFPLALVNYISLSGGGFEHVPGAGVRLKTLDELAHEFQIEKISPHPTRMNPNLLEECNRLEIKRQLSETSGRSLMGSIRDMVATKYEGLKLNTSEENIKNVLSWATNRITRLEDLVSPKLAFLWVLPINPKLVDRDRTVLVNLVEELSSVKFEEDVLKMCLRDFSAKNGMEFPELMKLLRLVLSGLAEGPGVVEMMQLLGKEQSLHRIKTVVDCAK